MNAKSLKLIHAVFSCVPLLPLHQAYAEGWDSRPNRDSLYAHRAENTVLTPGDQGSKTQKQKDLLSVEKQRHRQDLAFKARDIKNPRTIDTLRGLSEEARAFLRLRYRMEHPLD